MTRIVLSLCLGLSFPGLSAAQDSVDLDAEIERMLEAVGGREVWRDATGFHMTEILHARQAELPIIREYWVDFEQPRIMERARTRGLDRTQALNIDHGWAQSGDTITHWSDGEVAGWRGFWPGIPTRVFHLLASDDPGVSVEWRDGVMDIFVDGEWAVWIGTNEAGLPVAYGRELRHSDTHFLGESLPYGDVVLWSEATEPTGDWRVVMIDYELYHGELPVSFEPAN